MIEMNQLIVEMLEHGLSCGLIESGHCPSSLYFLFNNPFNYGAECPRRRHLEREANRREDVSPKKRKVEKILLGRTLSDSREQHLECFDIDPYANDSLEADGHRPAGYGHYSFRDLACL